MLVKQGVQWRRDCKGDLHVRLEPAMQGCGFARRANQPCLRMARSVRVAVPERRRRDYSRPNSGTGMPSTERQARRWACLESRPLSESASFELDSSRSYAKSVNVFVVISFVFSERGQPNAAREIAAIGFGRRRNGESNRDYSGG